jgi:hypothetical protein
MSLSYKRSCTNYMYTPCGLRTYLDNIFHTVSGEVSIAIRPGCTIDLHECRSRLFITKHYPFRKSCHIAYGNKASINYVSLIYSLYYSLRYFFRKCTPCITFNYILIYKSVKRFCVTAVIMIKRNLRL